MEVGGRLATRVLYASTKFWCESLVSEEPLGIVAGGFIISPRPTRMGATCLDGRVSLLQSYDEPLLLSGNLRWLAGESAQERRVSDGQVHELGTRVFVSGRKGGLRGLYQALLW